MKRRDKPQGLMAEINITPFTDVILVLLIIFMVTTPLISQNSIEIKLPVSSSSDVVENFKQIKITVTGEGVIYLENQLLTSKELRQKMETLLHTNPDIKVIIAADQACRFQDVVGVIDIAKELGVKSLNISTRVNKQQ